MALNQKALEDEFRKDLPKDEIKKRKGSGSEEWDYVGGEWIRERLCELCGLDYNLETALVRHDVTTAKSGACYFSATVKARLALVVQDQHGAPRLVVREGHGSATKKSDGFPMLDQAIKSAETDAIKRVALTLGRHFGIGIKEQAGEDEGSTDSPTERKAAQQQQSKQEAKPATQAAAAKPATQAPTAQTTTSTTGTVTDVTREDLAKAGYREPHVEKLMGYAGVIEPEKFKAIYNGFVAAVGDKARVQAFCREVGINPTDSASLTATRLRRLALACGKAMSAK